MTQKILITSGKGGVGTSTVCAFLGGRLAAAGKKVLMIELSQRSLDLMFGLSDRVVYDLGDLIEERCEPASAQLSTDDAHLQLICAPAIGGLPAGLRGLKKTLEQLGNGFDYLLLDADGRDTRLMQTVGTVCDRAVIVSTADRASARDSRKLSDLLAKSIAEIRLCVNMLPSDFLASRPVPDLDWMIDTVCAQLIAVVPLDPALISLQDIRSLVSSSKQTTKIFDNFAQRTMGNYIDLCVN